MNATISKSQVLPGLWVFVLNSTPEAHGLATYNNVWTAHTSHGTYEGETMDAAIVAALHGYIHAVNSRVN